MDYETNKADQWHHAYSYDADNRITAVYTTSATPLVNDPLAMSSLQNEPLLNPTWEKEAAYSYYAHGPLARTVIGEQEVQGLDYVYTLQGWIKGVNSNNLDANNDPGKDGLGLSANHRVAQDVMGYSLHYFNNDYLPIVNGNTTFIADQTNSDMLQNSSDLYNGNIARMVTTITDPNSRAVLPLGNAYQYDQLNRLKHAVSFDQMNGNAWAGGAPAKYQNSFTYDANGNILTQTRNDDNNQVIDELAYFYPQNAANKTVRNRLLYVSDNVDYDVSDIDPGMATSNYAYDEEGRLIQDLQEGIDEINWRVDGKVKSIKQSDNKQGEFSLSFDYDAMGHRIAKHSYDKDQAYNNGLGQLVKSTYYVLDAQGNTMATYERSIDNGQTSLTFAQTEKFIYGSARLGVQNVNIGLLGSQNNTYTQTTVPHRIGKKGYELSNHLGNVLSVISDKVIPHSNGATVDYWQADILQSTDYSPFGVQLSNRTLSKNGVNDFARYGFSGKEADDEIKNEGNSYDFGARMLDPRLGRWLSIDPLARQYPDISPYVYVVNSPLIYIDPNGEKVIWASRLKNHIKFKSIIKNIEATATYKDIYSRFLKNHYDVTIKPSSEDYFGYADPNRTSTGYNLFLGLDAFIIGDELTADPTFISKVIIHEGLHDRYDIAIKEGKEKDFPTLHRHMEAERADPTGMYEGQHEAMAEGNIGTFVQGMREFDANNGTQHSDDWYNAMAWFGSLARATDDWQNMESTQKQKYQRLIDNENSYMEYLTLRAQYRKNPTREGRMKALEAKGKVNWDLFWKSRKSDKPVKK